MEQEQHKKTGANYGRLAIMVVLSFISMYVRMYAMVDRWSNIHPSLNQAYMAALMTAPMVVIEIALMGMMYHDRRMNIAILAGSVVIGLLAFGGIRSQFLIGDAEFLRSMIPHHAGAILMCREADLSDPEILRLCQSIRAGQQREVDQMEAILQRERAARQ